MPEKYETPIARARFRLVHLLLSTWNRSLPDTNIWTALETDDIIDIVRIYSIAQHYGLPTQCLDLTSDYQVALFFATHHFEENGQSMWVPGEHIIYRINRQILEEALEVINGLSDYESNPIRLADIGSTPPELAPRASLQRGWSLTNVECPWLLIELISRNGIEAFVFQSDEQSNQNTYTQADLMPPQDGFQTLLQRYATKNTTLGELQAIIN